MIGKYQAVSMSGNSALILDTEEGHLWSLGASKEKGVFLVYQGRVSPGKEMGDIVDQFPSEEPK
jgi:hypothetical protein